MQTDCSKILEHTTMVSRLRCAGLGSLSGRLNRNVGAPPSVSHNQNIANLRTRRTAMPPCHLLTTHVHTIAQPTVSPALTLVHSHTHEITAHATTIPGAHPEVSCVDMGALHAQAAAGMQPAGGQASDHRHCDCGPCWALAHAPFHACCPLAAHHHCQAGPGGAPIVYHIPCVCLVFRFFLTWPLVYAEHWPSLSLLPLRLCRTITQSTWVGGSHSSAPGSPASPALPLQPFLRSCT